MAEVPLLKELYAKYLDQGVAVVGISLDDMIPGDRGETKNRVVKFLDSKQVAYPNAYYIGSSDALADAMNIDGAIPITIIYDSKGKELWRRQGTLDQAQATKKIQELLKVR